MKKTICVDMDGVLADYSKGWQGIDIIGDPIPGAVEFTRELSKVADVVIFTCRCTEEMQGRNGAKAHLLRNIVRAWLDTHGFVYADIYVGQGKPIASAYVDDRPQAPRRRVEMRHQWPGEPPLRRGHDPHQPDRRGEGCGQILSGAH